MEFTPKQAKENPAIIGFMNALEDMGANPEAAIIATARLYATLVTAQDQAYESVVRLRVKQDTTKDPAKKPDSKDFENALDAIKDDVSSKVSSILADECGVGAGQALAGQADIMPIMLRALNDMNMAALRRHGL